MSDQAEGLRRLLAPRGPRVIAVAGGGRHAGGSTVTANLAVALAGRGRSVLVLDEQGGARGAAAILGGAPRATLGDTLAGRCALAGALAQVMPGLRAMSTGGAADALNSPADADAFSDAVEDAVPDLDFLLIDAGPGPGTARVALAPAAPEFMVVLGGQPRSLKEGYALVKLMNRVYARRQFQVVLARAGEADAATQLGNFVHTCKRHLGIEPVRLGQIPFDPQIENCGRLGRPVAGTFPETPAAAIFRAMAEVLDNGLYACLDPSRGHPLVRLLAQSSRLQSNPLWAAVQ